MGKNPSLTHEANEQPNRIGWICCYCIVGISGQCERKKEKKDTHSLVHRKTTVANSECNIRFIATFVNKGVCKVIVRHMNKMEEKKKKCASGNNSMSKNIWPEKKFRMIA